jgi:hypothetical protein
MMTLTRTLLILIVLSLVIGCGGGSATETPSPSNTPPPADVPQATDVPQPTPTAQATDTPAPTTAPEATASPTPTPTPVPPIAVPTTPPPEPNPCAGLSAALDMRVLVGPADAVGLEPLAVGTIPFAVTGDEAPYLVTGGGPISYADILTEQWGTYEVTMDLQNMIAGECVPNEDAEGGTLQLDLEMTGSQLVVVEADGFQGEYPWSGSHTFDLPFPLEEGATIEGEGWAMVLQLN